MATCTDDVFGILSSALSLMTGSTVLTYDQYTKEKEQNKRRHYQHLNIDQLFKITQPHGTNEPGMPSNSGRGAQKAERSAGFITVFIKTMRGKTFPITVSLSSTLGDLKRKIEYKEGIPAEMQRLYYPGLSVDTAGNRPLQDYNLQNGSTIHLSTVLRGGGFQEEVMVLPSYCLDPKFNYDFTSKVDDGKIYKRGGHKYVRPYGWKRYALKVLGKYDNDKWLGSDGIRTYSSDSEWPVSYHGTGNNPCEMIAKEGYRLDKGKRFKHGHGIYSSPSIAVAASYSKPFYFKGGKIIVVFQNRVCPSDLRIIETSRNGDRDDYWVTEFEDHIRPYGICVKNV